MGTKAKQPDKHWLDPPEWWKKWKPLRWVAISVIIAGIVSTFTAVKVLVPKEHPEAGVYTAVVSERVRLLGEFQSYDDIETVSSKLEGAGYTFSTSRAHRQKSDKAPPFNFDSIVVPIYKHLGVPGELSLEFFNNRLYEASFEPKDVPGYARELRKLGLEPRADRNMRAEVLQGPLRITSNVDFALSDVGRSLRTTPYAIWQDRRLIEQRDVWTRTYGSGPQVIEELEEEEAAPGPDAAVEAPVSE